MLLPNFDLLATAPGGVARLRELILTLAVQGKLVPQDPSDEPAGVLLQKIRAEKDRLIAEGKIRRDKPLAEIADEEKPFEVPQGWEWVRLAALSEFENGDRGSNYPSRSKFVDQGVAFINAGHLLNERIDYSNMNYITQQNFDLLRSGKVQRNDILYCLRGSLGKFALVTEDALGAIASSLVIIRLVDSRATQYVMRYLESPLAASLIKLFDNGTAQPNLGAGDLAKFVMPLPPLAEQSRIVARVEELMRLCDALEAKGRLEAAQHAQLVSTLLDTLTDSDTPEALAQNWQRIAAHFDVLLDRPQAVDAFEQTILQLAVRGLLVPQEPGDEPASVLLQKIRAEKDRLILGGKIKRDKPLPPIAEEEKPFELPGGWEWVKVGDVVQMLNGFAFKSEWFKPSGVRLLRNVNIGHGTVDWTQPVFVDESAANEFAQFALRQGDIVLTLDRPLISTGLKLAVLTASDLPCLLLQRVAKLAPDHRLISSEFLFLWLQSDLFVDTIDPGRSNGVPHISTKQVSGLIAGLPPLAEQSRIVARVEELRRLCADLRQRLSASQTAQAHLAEALVESVGA